MSKKIYSLIMAFVILVGAIGINVGAEETAETTQEDAVEKESVSLEEAQKKLASLTEREKEAINGQKPELKELLVPSITEDFYLNDFANLFADEEKKKEIIDNAKKFDEDEKVKFVISTIEDFNDIDPHDYAILMHDTYKLKDGITLVMSNEEVGMYTYHDKVAVSNFDFEEKVNEKIEEYLKKKDEDSLIKLQTSLIDIYKEDVLKIETLVLDNEKIFSSEEIETLNKVAEDYKKEAGIGVCIVTSSDKLSNEKLEEYCKNSWVCVILSADSNNLEILITKDAEEYITNPIVKKKCNEIKKDLEEKKYGKAMISLQESLIKHFKEYNAKSDNIAYSNVNFKF